MKSILLFGFVAISFCSCKSLLTKYYGLNKEMDFKTGDEYLNYIEKKKKIPRSFLLIPDSNSYDRFMDTIYSQRLGYYFGTYLNDTVSVRRSQFLKDNVTCMGRVLTNIEEGLISLDGNSDSLYAPSKFKVFSFYEGTTGKLYNIDHSTKPIKIFLLYYYRSGKLFDKSFKEIFEIADKYKDQVEVKVIPTDKIVFQR